MGGIDPLRAGRDPQPPTGATPPARREAARIAPPAAKPPASAIATRGQARQAPPVEPPGLAALILACAAPQGFDRRLLQPDRLQAILGDVLADLDRSGEGDEVARLASAAIAEELARHEALARARDTALPLPAAEAVG
jgi:hypothetical protein